MFNQVINNCFDSHVHWAATGYISAGWKLSHLLSPQAISQEKILPQYFRGDWLVGFGWDEHLWPTGCVPHYTYLDQVFPHFPVALCRADGHAVWVNSLALRQIGLLNDRNEWRSIPSIRGGKILVDEEGKPTGVFVDAAKLLVDQLIPPPCSIQIKEHLLAGMKVFHQAGITHIRDMSGNEAQWNAVVSLSDEKKLLLAVEQNFSVEDLNQFEQTIDFMLRAQKLQIPNVRVKSLKVFYDGALGSEGALLSQKYRSGSGFGLELMRRKDLQELMQKTWKSGLSLAVHVIGDEAVHRVVTSAHELWEKGYQGQLQLEHVELLRSSTVKYLNPENITCYLQPCHWLSDRRWLKEKIDESLFSCLFPWRLLQQKKIPFFFGSDTPIEKPSIAQNWLALKESVQQGIPSLMGDNPLQFHTHPDCSWVSGCKTNFINGIPEKVFFRGALLHERKIKN